MSEPTFDLVSTHHVLALNIGVAGTLFGGMLLAWVDEAAALYASKAADNRFVTFELERVRFLLPCAVGDIVEVGARPLKASRSGLQLELRERRALVRLDVRPDPGADRGGGGRHRLDVPAGGGEVEQERRRRDLRPGAAGRRRRLCRACARGHRRVPLSRGI
jgi:acyl-coenzyme A thioesterase PaaI-like protein